MVLLALPPTIDCPPERCFCGRKTVETHEFLFCSAECARQDSFRSLGNPNCHYRNVVRDAYVRAGAQDLQPRRMMSAVHLRAGPTPTEQRGFANPPPHVFPPTNRPPLGRRDAWDQNMAEFPTLPGEPPVTERRGHDRSRRQGFQGPPPPAHHHPVPDHTFEQISLDAVPFPEHRDVPTHSLRRVPSSIDGIGKHTKKSGVAALLNFGRSRKGKEVEPERVFGHPVNTIIVAPVMDDPRSIGIAL